jgi:hypothetical protein
MRSEVPGRLRACAQVGVSLVLSFMVVWDLEAISEGVSSLRASRLAPFYNEVAPSLAVFGQLFGKALQAQARAPPADPFTLLLLYSSHAGRGGKIAPPMVPA